MGKVKMAKKLSASNPAWQKIVNSQQQEKLKLATHLSKTRLKHSAKGDIKTICLTMIVKNESKNMIRLFESLVIPETGKFLPSFISILDTGSTDSTIDLIIHLAKQYNVPCVVDQHPFENFKTSRTRTVRNAKINFPQADYALLSDADFVWKITKFDTRVLVDHMYIVKQFNANMSYWNLRMVSLKLDWVYECVTHEYIKQASDQSDFNGYTRVNRIENIQVDDREDGGCKTDKFIRDERLIKAELEKQNLPAKIKSRYNFYLGQTLKDVGKFAESLIYYSQRVDDGGWDEEIYYSKYQIGYNYEKMAWEFKKVVELMAILPQLLNEENYEFIRCHNPDNLTIMEMMAKAKNYFATAIKYYQQAYEYRKCRSESLRALATVYYVTGYHQEAFDTCIIGRKIKFPIHETLFVEDACYSYIFDFLLTAICANLTHKHQFGKNLIAEMKKRTDLPKHIITGIMQHENMYK